MLSDKHLKKHIKQWTRDWTMFGNANGFTINTLAAVTKESPERIGKLLHDTRQFTPYWCTTVRGYVWSYNPGKPRAIQRYDAYDEWQSPPGRKLYGPNRMEVMEYAVGKAYEFPGTSIHAGRPDDEEFQNVVRFMGWTVPETEQTDEDCIHCKTYVFRSAQFFHLNRWGRRYSDHNRWDYIRNVPLSCDCKDCVRYRELSDLRDEAQAEKEKALDQMHSYRENRDYYDDPDYDYDYYEDCIECREGTH